MPVRNPSKAGTDTLAVNVETSDPPVEMTPSNDSETEGYVNTDSESENKQPVIGTLVMKTVGIVKRKKKRKARCKICGNSCNNVKELNQHHKDTHDIVFCLDCDKAFSTHTSLDKHMYVHKDMDYVCGPMWPKFSFREQTKTTQNHSSQSGHPSLHGKKL